MPKRPRYTTFRPGELEKHLRVLTTRSSSSTPSISELDTKVETSQEPDDFEDWMREVALEMEAGYGLNPDDLPDCSYEDWHSVGLDPAEAAQEAISLCMSEI